MYEKIRKELIKMSNTDFAKLTLRVCPDADIENILGIKIPDLRKKAKEIIAKNEFKQYLEESFEQKNNKYIEETILQGLVIAYSKIELSKKLEYMKMYIPKIDSWLINDTVCSTLKVKKPQEQKMLWEFILPYLKSPNQFKVRFAVITMLDNFLIDEYVDTVISKLDKVKNTGYYTQMAIAWTLAEIGIKFNDKAMEYLKGKNNLDNFTFNKTLQKMRESYRVSKEQKEVLKSMKRI